ncbi:NAD(P)-binding protein [Auriculariales sp. MPI-PUGE-AT-0066]|nr:NAD(P)-binding protein [Auriculariales sp. MPI-PUGE-AT-0066]
MASHTEFKDLTNGEEVVAAFPEQVAGRIFIITGPTTGNIGAATATALAKAKPAAIVLAGRTPSKFQQVADEIKRIDATVNVISVVLDLGSFASVRAAAKAILENDDISRVDVVVNNAGIMAQPYSLTSDGIESQFGVCHVGHFLFTNLLMPKLKLSDNPTIVNVSSSGHRFGLWDFSDYNWEKRPYNIWNAYGQGKSANVLFTVSLAERGIRSIALHPGWVLGTELGSHIPEEEFNVLGQMIAATPAFEYMPNKKNIAQGASTVLVGALDQKLPNGSYLHDCQVIDADPHAIDPALAKQLWELSNKLTGENFA